MSSPLPAKCVACNEPLSANASACQRCGTPIDRASASALFAPAPPVSQPPAAATSPWDAVLERLRDVTQGEFEIGRELGRGGMAAVFLARDLALNRRVAIKVMAPGLMMGEGMIERFRQEAITIANLSHPHIVSIYAVRQLEDLHFFVMQFIAGQSLESVLRTRGRLPVSVVRAIMFQVGSALGYAHRRGVVHRDIKPGNILMSGDGDALVTDFGIAKVAEGPTQTQTGMVVGTPTYMSPEQCFARPIDGRSDQYSLGVVAYELLAGVTPFVGSSFEIMRGHTNELPPSLSAYRDDLPPELEAAIARMLDKSPDNRFPGLSDALEAMGAAAVGEGSALRHEMIELAAVNERRTMLGDLLQTPRPATAPGSGGTGGVTGGRIGGVTGGVTGGGTGGVTGGGTGGITGGVTAGSTRGGTDGASQRAASVRLELPAETLHVGDVTQVTAIVVDEQGRAVNRPMEWNVVGRSVQIAHSGSSRCTVECTSAGASVLTATCDGFSGSAVLQVAAERINTVPVSAAAVAPPTNVPGRQPRRRAVWTYAAVGILVLAAGAAGFAALLQSPDSGRSTPEGAEPLASAPAAAAPAAFGADSLPAPAASADVSDRQADPVSAIDSGKSTKALANTVTTAPVSGSNREAERNTRTQPTDPQPKVPTVSPQTEAADGRSVSQREEQLRLAREARATVESFAAAVETRQIARVRAVYPGLSSGNVETFENMFRGTSAVRMRIGDIRVLNGAPYNAEAGSRTYLTADVTFEMIPLGGGTIPPAADVLPVTLQRTSSGWRLEQIGVP